MINKNDIDNWKNKLNEFAWWYKFNEPMSTLMLILAIIAGVSVAVLIGAR